MKTVKVPLQVILHKHHESSKDKVLSTVFTEADAVANNRPLTYIFGDAHVEPSLNPFNFLIGSNQRS